MPKKKLSVILSILDIKLVISDYTSKNSYNDNISTNSYCQKNGSKTFLLLKDL